MTKVKTTKKKEEKLKELKHTDTIVLKDFHAKWCQPCKMQDKIIEELKENYDEKIIFEDIDIDRNEKITKKSNVNAVPTLIIERNGIEIKRFIGVTSKKILENELDNLLSNVY